MTNKNIFKCSKAAIINRSFWPESPIPGAALLALAEELSEDCDTFVLTQSNENLMAICKSQGRAKNVKIRACNLFTNSSSKIIFRIFEEFYFACWVFMKLCIIRPNVIYVATDPPVIAPLIVAVYSKIFGAQYTYHIQDIHPEASKIVFDIPFWIFAMLRRLDNFTLKNAESIVTLTSEMARYINEERRIHASIQLLENASAYPSFSRQRIKNSIIFCGNAGRMQEMPLIISAIKLYLDRGGLLKFTFIGAGLYSSLIFELSQKWKNVVYLGVLPLEEAIEIISEHEWGLLPVNNDVLNFAFPSKSSAYVAAGCKIFAVCEKGSTLAQWVELNKIGVISPLNIEAIVSTLFQIEYEKLESIQEFGNGVSTDYSFKVFASKLKKIITNQ